MITRFCIIPRPILDDGDEPREVAFLLADDPALRLVLGATGIESAPVYESDSPIERIRAEALPIDTRKTDRRVRALPGYEVAPTRDPYTPAVDYVTCPRIPREQFRVRWIDDFWDGPITGMLEVGGRLHRFECRERVDDWSDCLGPRRYVVLQLMDQELADEGYWHDLFVEHVGDHWTARDDVTRGRVKSTGEHAKFYEPFKNRVQPDYSNRSIVGWIAF